MKVFIALLIISLYGTILGCEDGGEDPGMKDEIALPKVAKSHLQMGKTSLRY